MLKWILSPVTGLTFAGLVLLIGLAIAGYAPHDVGPATTFRTTDLVVDNSATIAGNTRMTADTISGGYALNASGALYINPVGYQGGTTQYEHLEVDDGKGTGAGHAMIFVDSSLHNVGIKTVTPAASYDMDIGGGGDLLVEDQLTCGGLFTSTFTGITDGAAKFGVHLVSPIKQTIDTSGVGPPTGVDQGYLQVMDSVPGTPHIGELESINTFITAGIDTTGGPSQALGVQISNSAHIEAGANTLNNYGVQVAVSGGTNNYAWQSTAGIMEQKDAASFLTSASFGAAGQFIIDATSMREQSSRFVVAAGTGDTTILGSLTTGAGGSSPVWLKGDHTYIGVTPGINFENNVMSFLPTVNAPASGGLNYDGYNSGASQPRDMYVWDGKTNTMAVFSGANQRTEFVMPVGTTGNGYQYDVGNVPTVTACGASPSFPTTRGMWSGTVTEGAGATGCVLTFSIPLSGQPSCTLGFPGGVLVTYSVTNTALTLGALPGGNISFDCKGH